MLDNGGTRGTEFARVPFILFYLKEIFMSIKTVLLSAAISLAAVAIAARVPQIKSVVFGA